MKRCERTIIYGTLAVLVLVNLSMIVATFDRPAAAREPVATEDQLGPADSVSLRGDKELVIRNKAGHLAWNEGGAHNVAYGVGFMHVGKALSQIMESEEYVDERNQLDEELTAKDEELKSRAQAFMEENKNITQDSPEFEEVAKRFGKLREEQQLWEIDKRRQRGQLASGQIEKAYRDVISAVEVVSDRHDIDIVYRFIPAGDPFESANPEQASQAVLARVALRYPDGLDITREVLEEMSLTTD